MNRDESTGRFIPGNRIIATCRGDLPKTNKEVVLFDQSKNILPSVQDGIPLVLKEQHSQGHKYNDGLVFYSKTRRTYPSIMPQLDHQSNLPLVQTHSIIYDILT